MTIALHTTAGAPDYRPWPVVDLRRDARLCQVQNDEMLRFFAQGDRAALRCLDLDEDAMMPAVLATGERGFRELKKNRE